MEKVLLLPILSARDKAKDGYAYRLTKDGNMHGILNAYYYLLNKYTTIIGIPAKEHIEDLADFVALLAILGFKGQLRHFPYGKNIEATRHSFSISKEAYSFVISGIPDVMPDVYLANTSKQIGISQPCDKWLYKDLRAMHNAKLVFVLDKGQKALLPNSIMHKVYISSNSRLCNSLFMQKVLNAGKKLDYSTNSILVPYNLSDPSYKTNWSLFGSFEDVLLLNPRNSYKKPISGLAKPDFYSLLASIHKVYLPINKRVSHMLYHELAWFGYVHDSSTDLWTR